MEWSPGELCADGEPCRIRALCASRPYPLDVPAIDSFRGRPLHTCSYGSSRNETSAPGKEKPALLLFCLSSRRAEEPKRTSTTTRPVGRTLPKIYARQQRQPHTSNENEETEGETEPGDITQANFPEKGSLKRRQRGHVAIFNRQGQRTVAGKKNQKAQDGACGVVWSCIWHYANADANTNANANTHEEHRTQTNERRNSTIHNHQPNLQLQQGKIGSQINVPSIKNERRRKLERKKGKNNQRQTKINKKPKIDHDDDKN